MTWRRLRVLIQHLPPESHTMTALRNAMPDDELEAQGEAAEPEKGRWSQLEQLIGMSIDVQRQHLHAFYVANSNGKGKKPEPPEPIRRPGARPPKKRAAPLTDAGADVLFKLINGGVA